MSLLLEALKKAELAKQGKQPAGEDATTPTIEFETAPSPAGASQPKAQDVITRGELPDISQPLEILSEDLPSASAKPAPGKISVEPMSEQPVRRAPPPRPASAAEPEFGADSLSNPSASSMDSSGDADRDAARQLFEAKEVEYHPRRNFYITIGLLVAIGAGYGGYVWWELQPKSVYNPAALQAAAKAAAAAPVSQAPAPQPQEIPAIPEPPAAASAPPPAAPLPAAAQSTAAQPSVAAARASAARATATAPAPGRPVAPMPGPVFARKPATGAPAAARASAPTPGSAPAEPTPIAVTPRTIEVDPLVVRGFEVYQRGNLALAREAYEQALRRNPFNRDALLGMAAIDLREGRFNDAQARYVRLLELDPRDVNAVAGLTALRGQLNPAQSESRLKSLIAINPDAAALYFALGNQYAQQARWADAQEAYFKSYAGDSENADFAVNLAISLDQLRQTAPALEYYRRAVALAANRPYSFNLSQIRARIQDLERP